MPTLEIKNLHVSVENKEILKGVDLTVNAGEIHALMGPNGNGKSTLLLTIMGHPKYTVTEGSITFDGKDVLQMSVDQRSKAGLFIAMQNPQEVPGVTNSDFLKAAVNAHREQPIRLFEFIRLLDKTIDEVGMKSDMAHRFLNEGFSGGEKKRNEIIQMKLLKPQLAMLDELDSGLDVDALKIVADNVLDVYKQTNMGMIIVSHYERFYELIRPTHAHVLVNGRIVKSGDHELARKIDAEGYEWLIQEQNLVLEEEEPVRRAVSLGTCAANVRGKSE
ncbi:MAG: Fe-S cluster assembly ATPase SufC [Erysipelotrichaceae bacterium]|nr:Fe-S cluster assembly ATPase SufC [Erysipelotrichaceae bacterium]